MLEKNVKSLRIREPIQQRGKKSKEGLIAAARTLINRDGFDELTAQKISQAAGVSIGTFYAYFLDKDDIFRFIVADYADQQYQTFYSDAQETLRYHLVFEEAIGELLRRFYEMHRSEPRLHEEIVVRSYKDPAILAVLDKNDQRIVDQLLAFLAQFVPPDTLEPVDVYLIQATLKANVHEFIFNPPNLPPDDLLSGLTRMIFLFIEDLKRKRLGLRSDQIIP